MERFYFSREGIHKFSDQIKGIEKQIIDLQAKMDEFAKTGGNLWHDNFAYENARRDITMLSNRVGHFYYIRGRAEIIDYPKEVEHVQMGCRVTFRLDGKEDTYDVVGFGESDPDNKRIAYNAPLAKVMILKKPGDKFTEKINGFEKRLEVIAIQPIP